MKELSKFIYAFFASSLAFYFVAQVAKAYVDNKVNTPATWEEMNADIPNTEWKK